MTEEKVYAITINKKIYRFACTDGEDHVNAIKNKLLSVIDSLSMTDSGHILSDYVMKIAISLADDAVRAERNLKNREDEIHAKCAQLLEKISMNN